jgi:Holliday junction resolvasome RuvABC ATP-dependent DNA helicase subunit
MISPSKNTQDENSPKTVQDELFLDQTLRPSEWDEYIGQKNIISLILYQSIVKAINN